VTDASTPEDARAILETHGVRVTDSVQQVLTESALHYEAALHPEVSRTYHIVASGMTALRSAADWCRQHGIEPAVLGDDLQGEARELAREQACMALELARTGNTCCLLSGGETTVTLNGTPGRGGRNTEYALALALALDGQPGIWALAADSDGIDGSGGHSGAMIDPDTLQRAAAAGLDAESYLRTHDSAGFFEQIGGLLAEGPTGTNVNDFRAILVNP
jgi:hydroxypyruvate reductase